MCMGVCFLCVGGGAGVGWGIMGILRRVLGLSLQFGLLGDWSGLTLLWFEITVRLRIHGLMRIKCKL